MSAAQVQEVHSALQSYDDEVLLAAFTGFLEQRPELKESLLSALSMAASERYIGTIKQFDPSKGCGFIDCQDTEAIYGLDVWIQAPAIGTLKVGSIVEFSVRLNRAGNPQAEDLQDLSGIVAGDPSAMAPQPQQQLQQQQQQKQQPQGARRAPQSGAAETPASPACVDAISEVSTMSSDRVSSDGGGQPVASGKDGFSPGASTPGTASGAASPSSAQAWSSVPSKAKSGAALGKAQGKGAGAGGRATGGSPSSAVTVAAAVVWPSNSVAARPSPKARPGDGGKGEGKGRGLQFFRKIEVGVEDEPDFRVVSRLIGPKGRHMQDILNEAKGTKIWIIGKGSRSWEDDVGPLIVCVGAGSSMAFETAVRLVEELLGRIKEDHRRFLQNQQ